MAETPDIKINVETIVAGIGEFLEQAGTRFELFDIFQRVTAEFWRARELHGDQTDRPLGTGPERVSWFDGLIEQAHANGLNGRQTWTNTDVANLARDRCQAAAATAEGDTWEKICTEEYAELLAEDDPAAFEAEAVQTIAMLVNAIMAARKVAAAA